MFHVERHFMLVLFLRFCYALQWVDYAFNATVFRLGHVAYQRKDGASMAVMWQDKGGS